MKHTFFIIALLSTNLLESQVVSADLLRGEGIAKHHVVNMSEISEADVWDVNILNVRQQPMPASDFGQKKTQLNAQRVQARISQNPRLKSQRSTAPQPEVTSGFMANSAQGTPNDNHVAISNDGKIVSVVNTNVRIYNESGTQLQSKTLIGFANLGIGTNTSDPRVLYDPWEDRFIIHFFTGGSSTTSFLILGFSQTSDPTGLWNVYQLSGNIMNDTTWSDYPIVALNDKDFFMTYNHLKDGEDWKTGFRYSAIWQIDKTNGYLGDTLQYNYWNNIKHDGKSIWSVCAVQPSYINPTPETYFLSVRPGDLNNDTVFLHTISNSYESGSAQFSTKVLKTNISYGLPPNGLQTDNQFLATNDARVLAAICENNKIQYVQNTLDAGTSTAAVYLGMIENPASATPAVSGQIISEQDVDFAYPSIAYMGSNSFDNRSLITCSYSAPDTFPGTVVFYVDAQGNVSEKKVVKNGLNTVDVMQDSVERWGDYTGIQRKFNEPNAAWLAGSYSLQSQVWRTWIAKVLNTDSALVSSTGTIDEEKIMAYPNPSSQRITVEFESAADNFTLVSVYSTDGKLIRHLFEDRLKTGTNKLTFNTPALSNGLYILKIADRNISVKTQSIVIQH